MEACQMIRQAQDTKARVAQPESHSSFQIEIDSDTSSIAVKR